MFIYALLVVVPMVAFAQGPLQQLENKIFAAVDKNGDGKISKMEAEQYMMGFDANKDTKVSKQEFIAAIDKIDATMMGHENAMFTLLDADSDGNADKKDIDAAFDKADTNGDGNINKAEFHDAFNAVVTIVGK